MKTLIIYFSQTGHTKKVAETIQDGITNSGNSCDLQLMSEVCAGALKDYDLIGFGCPVFYFQEPLNVREFLQDLPDLTGSKWFLFCTHGSIIGNTFPSLHKLLSGKRATITGFHDTYADATLPFYPHPTLTSGHPDEIDLEAAREFGRQIVKTSREIMDGRVDLIPEPEAVPEEWTKNAAMFTRENMAKIFPPLSVNTDLCSECGECEAACPVGGIDISASPLKIQQPCVYCWHCLNICPECAIEADLEKQIKLAPKLYERYRYWLDKAAEKGEFRWLVDPDSMDFENVLVRQKKRSC